MTETNPLDALSPRHRAFVAEYLQAGHATKAARAAGYAWPDKQGSRLLARPDIRAVVDRALAEARDSRRKSWEAEDRAREAERDARLAALMRRPGRRGRYARRKS